MISLLALLYEAAVTPGAAAQSGIVAVTAPVMGDVSYVLLDKEIFLEGVEEFVAEDEEGSMDQWNWQPGPEIVAAIVGLVDLSKVAEDLFKVGYSASLTGYGPLAYQLAMNETGGWLRSDSSVTTKALGVWNKMYELSEQGVYQRRFLGDFSNGPKQLKNSAKAGYKAFPDQMSHSFEEEQLFNEQEFLSWLSENGIEPRQAGWFWAYKLSSPSSAFSELLSSGEEMMNSLTARYQVPRKTLDKLVGRAAWRFFRAKYEEGRRQQ